MVSYCSVLSHNHDVILCYCLSEYLCVYSCRGDTFRKEFSQLGDARSLIPETVRIMALTTTATKPTRRAIIRVLRKVNPEVVSNSPNKVNIKYAVKLNSSSLEKMFAPLLKGCAKKGRVRSKPLYFVGHTISAQGYTCLWQID